MNKYNPKEIEKKWQKFWDDKGVNKTRENKDREKYYILDMFPYPSGAGLHVGHPKGYIATDVIARMKMMQGFNVLHPMGWDAFGLPAENYAIANKVHPKKAVDENIATFKKQLGKIGFTYDWDREIDTTDPKYYKWTQWIFLQMLKKGLAFESYEPINWCPSCQTGLANEDLEDGKCERCGSVVERKPMRQWVLKITGYADRLLNDLDKLTNWPDAIREMQRHWIGRSEGTLVKFDVISENDSRSAGSLEVFTTRVDTLFGATYVVIAPEHKLIHELESKISNLPEIKKYEEQARTKSDLERTELQKDKTGVVIKGLKVVNPVNGKALPVYVGDYVLGSYGTGAVMAVPSHDERDFEFAVKHDLSIKEVIIPKVIDQHDPPKEGEKTVFREAVQVILIDPKTEKVLALKWKKFPWTTFITGGVEKGEDMKEAAKREVLEETGYKNIKYVRTLGGPVESHFYANHKKENRKAHFTAFVFELVNDEREQISEEEKAIHDLVWMTWKELGADKNVKCSEYDIWIDRMRNPVHAFVEDGVLIASGEFTGLTSEEAREKITALLQKQGKGQKKVNYKLRDWVFSRQRYWGEPIPVVHCEKCGVVPISEDELPVELPKVKNYEPSGTGESPLANISEWVNTKCPKCEGPAKRETNTMPQWAGSSWYYLRYIDPNNDKALVDKKKEKYWSPVDFYVGGAEHATRHLIYARFWHKFLYDIGAVNYEEPFTRLQNVGLILAEDGRKMSKRWGNVINPDDVVETYGADSLRLYEMFMGPFAQACAWSTNGLIGAHRFIEKVWFLQEKVADKAELDKKTTNLLHQTIKKVSDDIETMRFNTAIAKMMELVNELSKADKISKDDYSLFVGILAPFAPHIAEELWASLGHKKSIFESAWPKHDPALAQADQVTIAVQVNGKVRDQMEVAVDISENDVKELVMKSDKVQKWLEGKEPKKVIYVKGKLVSVVV
jgi:leucyl-tRNA synthetase